VLLGLLNYISSQFPLGLYQLFHFAFSEGQPVPQNNSTVNCITSLTEHFSKLFLQYSFERVID
ncbi:hypothetical protein ABFV57_32485, partial [Pseudomonas neuropathica]|uniref:hypothetical protein n=1 Tax=Pseudomonas neuropathica TaxID=2730425 RepID=UPI0034D68E6F